MINNNFNLIANIIAKNGMKLKADKNWAIDLHSNTIFYPQHCKFNNSDIGFILHECGHKLFTESDANFNLANLKAAKNLSEKQFFEIVNCFEDLRINKLVMNKYAGAVKYIHAINAESFAMNKYHYQTKTENQRLPERDRLRLILLAISYELEQIGTGEKILDAANEFNSGYYIYQPQMQVYKKVLSQAKNTQDLIDLIKKDILPILRPLFCLDPSETVKLDKIIQKILKKSNHGKSKKMPLANPEQELKKEKRKNVFQSNFGKMAGQRISKKEDKDCYYSLDLQDLHEKTKPHINQIKKALLKNKQKLFKRDLINLKSGKIDFKKLSRLKVNNFKVFRQPEKNIIPDTTDNYTFLLDLSGSMHGNITETLISFNCLAFCLNQLQKKFSLISFSEKSFLLKDFGEKWQDRFLTQAFNICQNDNFNGGTNLLPALQMAEFNSKKWQGKSQSLIIITDGATSEFYNCQEKIRNLEKTGLKIMAFGIRSDSVLKLCKKSFVIKSIEELAGQLNNLIKLN